MAFPSLFEFCVRHLRMSEGEAFRRITAARLVRRFPSLFGYLERGEVHLSALVLLRDYLTDSNHDELLREASGKSRREVQELLARRFPKPDVPTTIRPVPSDLSLSFSTAATTAHQASGERAAPPRPSPEGRGQTSPLSEARYKLELTVSAELRDKLERATRLMRHRNPKGDLAIVLDKALDRLLAELEKERLGKTERPQRARQVKAGRISRAVRREVFARDGEQCTYLDEAGHRCPAHDFLELDHIVARALGGSDEASNLRVRCRGHNAYYAEQVFGREHIRRRIHLRQNKYGQKRAPRSTNVSQKDRAADVVEMSHKDDAAADAIDLGRKDSVPYANEGGPKDSASNANDRRRKESAVRVQATRDGGSFDLAMRGLTNMGFHWNEARRAIAVVRGHLGAESVTAPPAERVLREALAVLC